MENHYNCIYMYTNKINSKGYVGKAEDFLKRKQQHIYHSYNKKCKDYNVPFHRAIRKYGIESFEVTILKENLTEDEMNYWEDYYIETFDLYAKNGKGYNIAKGGRGGNAWEGKTEEEGEEWKQKISKAKKGENHPMYGKRLSEEHKQKLSEAKKGKNHPQVKRIAQYDKQGNLIKIWDYIKQASEELGINYSGLCSVLQGRTKTHQYKGYIWRYVEENE